jgi:Protein of unknown function (DUF2442)
MREVPYIRAVEPAGDFALLISFGDGSQGIWRAPVEKWKGPMAEPLRDPAFFATAFCEEGALMWENGYDAGPDAIWQDIKASGALVYSNHAA